MTETFDNGTTVTFQKGTPEYNKHLSMNTIDFGNSTWTIYNATSGSVGKIIFHEEMVASFMHNDTWTRFLNGHVYKGFFIPPMGEGGYAYLQLCLMIVRVCAPNLVMYVHLYMLQQQVLTIWNSKTHIVIQYI